MTKKAINKEVLDQWEVGHKKEVLAVKALGDSIGYGNMMSIASALWELKLEKSGLSGAFIPALAFDMKKKRGEMATAEQKRRVASFKKMLK